jgi:ABC-type uncharacterized transport system involved in gliding motility auxiliary subunit
VEKLTKFSWVFLLLGLLTVITWGSYWFVVKETDNVWTALLIAAGVFFSAYAFFDRDTIVEAGGSRAVRQGSGAVLLTTLFGALCVGGYMLAKEHDKTWDLTSEKKFTLSEQTVSVLGGLQGEVKVYGFFRTDSPGAQQFDDLLSRMKEHAPSLQYEMIDPLRNPMMAEQFTITSENGTIVLQQGEERQRLESEFDEQALTNAFIKLLSGEDHKICWSVGHGEVDPDDDANPDGYGAIVLKLEDQNYTVAKSQIFTEGVAKDCEALVIARPQQDFLPHEREAVAAYLASGGRGFVLLEPEMVPELSADLERFGVKVGRDIVLEDSQANQLMGLDPSFLVLSEESWTYHPITDKLHAIVILGITRSVAKAEVTDGLDVRELAKTSPEGWGETSLTDFEKLGPTEGEDRIGEVPVMVAVEVRDPAVIKVAAHVPPPAEGAAPATPDLTVGSAPVPEAGRGVPADFAAKEGGRLVVIGDSDFASNQLMALGNNQDVFTNTIHWLVDETDQLGESADEEKSQRLTLNLIQEALLWLISIFLIPGAAIAAAIAVLVRRRFL